MKKLRETAIVSYDEEFKKRLNIICKEIGELKEAAVIADCTPAQLARWREGVSKPPLFAAATLCKATNRSLDWLVTGIDPRTSIPPLNEEAHIAAMQSVDEKLADQNIDSRTRALMVSAVYSAIIKD